MNLGLAYPTAMSLVSAHRETRADSLPTKPKWQIFRHGAIPWAVDFVPFEATEDAAFVHLQACFFGPGIAAGTRGLLQPEGCCRKFAVRGPGCVRGWPGARGNVGTSRR